MSETLIIRNFGPIKEVKLDLKKVNVLIGEQASGKSTVLKVLAVCRYFSYIVNYKESGPAIWNQSEFKVNEQFYQGLADWGLEDYLKPESEIIYKSKLYNFHFQRIDEKGKTKIQSGHPDFLRLLEDLDDLRDAELSSSTLYADNPDEWTPNENFYRLNVRKVMNNPFYIPTERALQTNSFGKDLLIPDAILDELIMLNRIVKETKKERKIDHLDIFYKNEIHVGYVKKDNEKQFYKLETGASGYQASIPINLVITYHNEILKRKRQFLIDEPELSLFPKTQKKLIDFLISQVNKNGHSLVIATHSPYILSSLNNLLYAYKIGSLEDEKYQNEVIDIIPKENWINSEDVSVYYLENGGSKNLLDTEDGLINIDDLDSVSEIVNQKFDKLLALEMQHQNENKS